MIDTVKKGNKIQRYARKYYESQGYTVDVAVRTSQKRGNIWISHNNDFFGAFDMIATKIGSKPIWSQTTVINKISTKLNECSEVPLDLNFNTVEILGYKGGKPSLDKRFKNEKIWKPSHYFKVYRLVNPDVWSNDSDFDIHLKEYGIDPE